MHIGLIMTMTEGVVVVSLWVQHELVVRAADPDGVTSHTIVQVAVGDVNDNPPTFLHDHTKVEVVEEEDDNIPRVIFKVG